MSINKAVISGNLTRDAELRGTSAGLPVLEFTVAVNDRFKDQTTGEWGDRPNFFNCVIFGKRAEALLSKMTKGVKVCVEGKLRYESWEKDGIKRSQVRIICDEIELLQYAKNANAARGTEEVELDDIPF